MTLTLVERFTGIHSEPEPSEQLRHAEQLRHVPELDIQEGINVLAHVAVTEAESTKAESTKTPDEEDTVELALEDMSEYLAIRIEEDSKRKREDQENTLGLYAVHSALELSLTRPQNKKLRRLANAALNAFPGVAKSTLKKAYTISLNEELPLYEAIERVNEERLAS